MSWFRPKPEPVAQPQAPGVPVRCPRAECGARELRRLNDVFEAVVRGGRLHEEWVGNAYGCMRCSLAFIARNDGTNFPFGQNVPQPQKATPPRDGNAALGRMVGGDDDLRWGQRR